MESYELATAMENLRNGMYKAQRLLIERLNNAGDTELATLLERSSGGIETVNYQYVRAATHFSDEFFRLYDVTGNLALSSVYWVRFTSDIIDPHKLAREIEALLRRAINENRLVRRGDVIPTVACHTCSQALPVVDKSKSKGDRFFAYATYDCRMCDRCNAAFCQKCYTVKKRCVRPANVDDEEYAQRYTAQMRELEEKRKLDVMLERMEHRRAAGRCELCGGRLGVLDRLARRGYHRGCKVYVA